MRLRFQKPKHTPWMSASYASVRRSWSKCLPSFSLVSSFLPTSSTSMNDTPWPSEYIVRCVLRRWKKLLAILLLLAVKSTSLDPVMSKTFCTYVLMVVFSWRSYASAMRAVRYALPALCRSIASSTKPSRLASPASTKSWYVSMRDLSSRTSSHLIMRTS